MTEEIHQPPKHREEGHRAGHRAGHSAGSREHSDHCLGSEIKERVLVLREVSCAVVCLKHVEGQTDPHYTFFKTIKVTHAHIFKN